VNVFRPSSGAEQPYLTAWNVLGPFGWTEDGTPSAAAVSRQLDAPRLDHSETASGGPLSLPFIRFGKRIRRVDAANGLVRLHHLFDQSDFLVAYAECVVESSMAQTAALLVEADDGILVWLNGELVVRKVEIRKLHQFDHYVVVRIERGENRIVVKSVHTVQKDMWEPWSFAVGIRSMEGARAEEEERGMPGYVQEMVLGRKAPLSLDLTLFPRGSTVHVRAATIGGTGERSWDLEGGQRRRLDLGNPGYEALRVEIASDRATVVEPVLRGTPRDWLAHYESELPQIMRSEADRSNLGALLFRLRHLLRKENESPADIGWQRKIAYVVSEIEEIRSDLKAGREAYRGKPGTHFRAYRSPGDGQLRSFIVHWPETVRPGEKTGLVIAVPYSQDPLRPFLESVLVAEYEYLRIFDRDADRHGLAFIELDAGGNTDGQQMAFAEIDAAVRQVQADYPIDPDRIYLYGVCSGGRDALALAEAHPSRFAAIALLSPATAFGYIRPPQQTDAYACGWLKKRSPLGSLRNLAHIPLLVIHGDADEHIPIAVSKELCDKARAEQLDYEFRLMPGGTQTRFPFDPRRAALAFFEHKRLVRAPRRVDFASTDRRYNQAYWLRIDRPLDASAPSSIHGEMAGDGQVRIETENVAEFNILKAEMPAYAGRLAISVNGKSVTPPDTGELTIRLIADAPNGSLRGLTGPISDAFTQPFLAVVGTGPEASGATRAQAERFAESWRRRFFAECPIKADRDVNEHDIQLKHLILFGSAASNSVLARIAPDLPISRRGEALVVGGRLYEGADVFVQAAFPNPLNRRRYVVLPGDPECEECPADAVQLALRGWYDCAVWRRSGDGQTRLEDVGFFDSEWRRFLPAEACDFDSRPQTAGRLGWFASLLSKARSAF
jgi:predicted esterase